MHGQTSILTDMCIKWPDLNREMRNKFWGLEILSYVEITCPKTRSGFNTHILKKIKRTKPGSSINRIGTVCIWTVIEVKCKNACISLFLLMFISVSLLLVGRGEDGRVSLQFILKKICGFSRAFSRWLGKGPQRCSHL